ncbi:Cyclic di-GMP phosphodiesterase YfgF [compost metagenome]
MAEWVEDERTLDALRAIGVDYAQGYVIGRPVPLDVFLAGCRQRDAQASQAAGS